MWGGSQKSLQVPNEKQQQKWTSHSSFYSNTKCALWEALTAWFWPKDWWGQEILDYLGLTVSADSHMPMLNKTLNPSKSLSFLVYKIEAVTDLIELWWKFSGCSKPVCPKYCTQCPVHTASDIVLSSEHFMRSHKQFDKWKKQQQLLLDNDLFVEVQGNQQVFV